MSDLIGTRETAQMLGMKPSYLSKCVSLGDIEGLPPYYPVKGRYMFDKDEVERWLQERRVDVYAEKRKQQSEGAKDGQ